MICGCVRNCESYLPLVFNNIIRIHKEVDMIHISEIVIAFDISTDNSLLCLQNLQRELKEKHNLTLTILINDKPLTSSRVKNICNARNSLMSYIKSHSTPPDYFIMMDFDDVCSKPINIDVLVSTLKETHNWDCVSFNNTNYYDFWALSIDKYAFSCWHWSDPHDMIRRMNIHLQNKIDVARRVKYNMITCDSAFNGFGIYKLALFQNSYYSVDINIKYFNLKTIEDLMKTTKQSCKLHLLTNDTEHRHFHLKAKLEYGTKNMIWCDNLFPPYTGEHAAFLR